MGLAARVDSEVRGHANPTYEALASRQETTMTTSNHIALRAITFATVRTVIGLRVGEQQNRFVAPNATSIAEGLLNPGAWLRAIYADDVAIGFVMLLDPKIPGVNLSRGPVASDSVMLWRFMIAAEHQGRGYGKQALDLVCAHARRVGAVALLTSYVPGEHGPEEFYVRHGFSKTGNLRAEGREVELRLVL
jgi:diamine N-acetyltransferase